MKHQMKWNIKNKNKKLLGLSALQPLLLRNGNLKELVRFLYLGFWILSQRTVFNNKNFDHYFHFSPFIIQNLNTKTKKLFVTVHWDRDLILVFPWVGAVSPPGNSISMKPWDPLSQPSSGQVHVPSFSGFSRWYRKLTVEISWTLFAPKRFREKVLDISQPLICKINGRERVKQAPVQKGVR